jgi:hypothetical protein
MRFGSIKFFIRKSIAPTRPHRREPRIHARTIRSPNFQQRYDVPADRLATLDTAFAATMNDPDFRADTEKLQIDVRSIYRPRMQELVNGILSTPRPLIDRLKHIIE